MTAEPFTQNLIIKGTSNGRTIHMVLDCSDVNNEFLVAQDGNNFVQLPSDQAYQLIDIIVVGNGGEDTKFQELFVNSMNSGIKIAPKANLATSNWRQFQQAPITLKAGSMFRLQQKA